MLICRNIAERFPAVLSKAVEPLGDLHALLEVVARGKATVDHSRKFDKLKKTVSRAFQGGW